jgi:hypothetical protein
MREKNVHFADNRDERRDEILLFDMDHEDDRDARLTIEAPGAA